MAGPEAGRRHARVPRGAEELHVLGELRRAGTDGWQNRSGGDGGHSQEEAIRRYGGNVAIKRSVVWQQSPHRLAHQRPAPAIAVSSVVPAGSPPSSSPRCGSASAIT